MPQDASALEREPYDRILVLGQPHHGKAQPVDEPVLTPAGWREIGALKIGDAVIGADGQPTKVTGVFPRGTLPVFRVTTDDDAWTRCCAEHLWLTKTRSDVYRLDDSARVRTTATIVSTLGSGAPSGIHYLPRLAGAAEFCCPVDELPISPYFLGLLLGDGSISATAHNVGYTSSDEELIAAVELGARALGDEAVRHKEPTFTWLHFRGTNTREKLRALELYGCRSEAKHVPRAYLLASPSARLALLRGLCDTDGTVATGSGGTSGIFYTTSERLRDDVMFLVRSLGGRSRARNVPHPQVPGLPVWFVRLTFDDGTCPFALPRKAMQWRPREKLYRPRIMSIAADGEAECVCITVEAEDHLYVTRNFLVTHNSTSVVASACKAFGPGYVINCGKKTGLLDAARRSNKFKFDLIRDEVQMEAAIKEARKGAKEGDYKWIVLDDFNLYASWLEVALEDQTRNQKGEADGRRFWREYRKRLVNILIRCFDVKAHFYVISHYIETGGGLIDGQTEKHGVDVAPLFGGAARKEIPALFADVVFMAPNSKDDSKRSFFINPIGVFGPSCVGVDGTREIEADVGVLHNELKRASKSKAPSSERRDVRR